MSPINDDADLRMEALIAKLVQGSDNQENYPKEIKAKISVMN